MWLHFFMLAPLALLGHLALCVALFNRVHATAWPHRAIQAVSIPLQVAAVAMPIALGVWCVYAADELSGAGVLAWVVSPLAYLPICWIVAAYATLAWIYRRWFDQHAEALLSNHTCVAELPREMAGDFVTATLARIPGNQIFQLNVHEKTVSLPRMSPVLDGLTIAHLSDLHFTGQLKKEFFQEVVDRTNALDADVVALTGDLIDNSACIDWIPDTIGRLHARYVVFFVLGNHDLRVSDVPYLRRALVEAGLTDLGGRWITLNIGEQPVVLAGNELPWLRPAADLAADFDAARERQHPVEQDKIRRAFLDDDERFVAVAGFRNVKTFALEIVAKQRNQGGFVFDDKYTVSHCIFTVSFRYPLPSAMVKLGSLPRGRSSGSCAPLT